MEDMFFTKGDLVQFTTGEYSDYGINGTFVAIDTVHRDVVSGIVTRLKADATEDEEKNGWSSYDLHSNFVSELIKLGALITVDVVEHHIGSYGELDVRL